jgi:hypothetical protein
MQLEYIFCDIHSNNWQSYSTLHNGASSLSSYDESLLWHIDAVAARLLFILPCSGVGGDVHTICHCQM